MKLTIAICDDLREERVAMARMLRAYCQHKSLEVQLRLYSSGDELLASASGLDQINVLFLDIYMPGVSGVDTARQLRRMGKRFSIVFVTTSLDHGLESYEVEASDYLVKPIRYEDVARAMDWYMEHIPEGLRVLRVYSEGKWMDIPLASIMYIETLDHQSHIHTRTKTVVVRRGMNDLTVSIDSGDFLRCHRSFLVNMNFVRGVEGSDFYLNDGSRVPIRTGEVGKLREQFINWTYKKAWGKL